LTVDFWSLTFEVQKTGELAGYGNSCRFDVAFYQMLRFQSMKHLIFFCLILLATASGCKEPTIISIADLRERDDALSLQANALILEKEKLAPALYWARLEALRTEELRLFEDAQQCDFGDNLTEYNYWHRSRLKFPGKIAVALAYKQQ
jgi:hypothetical protein